MKTLIVILVCLWTSPSIANDFNFDVNLSEFTCEELRIAYAVNNDLLKKYRDTYEDCMISAMNDGFNEMFCAYISMHGKSNKKNMSEILVEFSFRCNKSPDIEI